MTRAEQFTALAEIAERGEWTREQDGDLLLLLEPEYATSERGTVDRSVFCGSPIHGSAICREAPRYGTRLDAQADWGEQIVKLNLFFTHSIQDTWIARVKNQWILSYAPTEPLARLAAKLRAEAAKERG